MVLLDERRTIVDANPAWRAMLGHSRSGVLGHHAWEFVYGGPAVSAERFRAVLLAGADVTGELELLKADGSVLPVQFAGHPETHTGHGLLLFVVIATHRAGARFRREPEPVEEYELTEREREVVRLLAHGDSAREIADELHISYNTVRTHIHKAMVKTAARSQAHLVAKALGDGEAFRD